MRATAFGLGALVCAGLFASPARAQYYSPVFCRPLPHAPDATAPGFYYWCPDGSYLGPVHCLRPPFPPFQGYPPPPKTGNGMPPQFQAYQAGMQGWQNGNGNGARVAFPSHQWMRGPRDFFMWDEEEEERLRFQRRPNAIP